MSDPRGDWDKVASLGDGLSRLNFVAYGAGTWAALGVGTSGAWVVTADDAAGPWTAYGYIGVGENYAISYGDGYWVVGGGIATATNPSYLWTENTNLPAGWAARSAVWADGSWGTANRGEIYSATDPSGSWTAEADLTPAGEDVLDTSRIAYLGGEWVVVFVTNGLDAYIYSAPSLGGTWTQRAVITPSSPGDVSPGLIGNFDLTGEGYFIQFDTNVWYASSLDGPWSRRDRLSDGLAYGDGAYVWTTSNIEVSDTVTGTVDLVLDELAHGAIYANDTWVAVGEDYSGGAVWVAGEGGDGWGLLL